MTPEERAAKTIHYGKPCKGPEGMGRELGLCAFCEALSADFRAALRERDAAWAKATVDAGRCSQNTRCSAVRMDWQACDRCAPLRALLEEAGRNG